MKWLKNKLKILQNDPYYPRDWADWCLLFVFSSSVLMLLGMLATFLCFIFRTK